MAVTYARCTHRTPGSKPPTKLWFPAGVTCKAVTAKNTLRHRKAERISLGPPCAPLFLSQSLHCCGPYQRPHCPSCGQCTVAQLGPFRVSHMFCVLLTEEFERPLIQTRPVAVGTISTSLIRDQNKPLIETKQNPFAV
jgi:hypothetical protein